LHIFSRDNFLWLFFWKFNRVRNVLFLPSSERKENQFPPVSHSFSINQLTNTIICTCRTNQNSAMEQMPKTANFPNEIKFKLAKMPAQGCKVGFCYEFLASNWTENRERQWKWPTGRGEVPRSSDCFGRAITLWLLLYCPLRSGAQFPRETRTHR